MQYIPLTYHLKLTAQLYKQYSFLSEKYDCLAKQMENLQQEQNFNNNQYDENSSRQYIDLNEARIEQGNEKSLSLNVESLRNLEVQEYGNSKEWPSQMSEIEINIDKSASENQFKATKTIKKKTQKLDDLSSYVKCPFCLKLLKNDSTLKKHKIRVHKILFESGLKQIMDEF